MNEYETCLRNWQADRASLTAYTALINHCQRTGKPLPESINPDIQLHRIIGKARPIYRRMNASGYDYYVIANFVDLDFDELDLEESEPGKLELDLIRDAINSIDSSESGIPAIYGEQTWRIPGGGDPFYTLPYECLEIRSIRPSTGFSFYHTWGNPTDEFVAVFEDLKAFTKATLANFPDLRFYELDGRFPYNNVYWDFETLIYLPAFQRTFAIVVQHAY